MSLKRSKYYMWVIVAVCFLIEFIALAFCSGTKGLFLSAITEALGIKRSLFAFNDTCRYVFSALIALFFGPLIHRFGTKKLIVAGFASLIASMTLYAAASNVFVFYLGGCFLGIGLGLTTSTMVTTIIRSWCKGPHVGKLLGLVMGANGLGGAVATKVLTPIIYREGDPFGYRKAYMLIVPLLIVVAVLAIVFLTDPPEGTAAPQKKKARGQSWPGVDYLTVRRRPYYYAALIGVFLTGMMLQGMTGVSVAHMTDTGLSPEFVATVWSLHSLVLTCAKFLTGACYDRFGLRFTMLVSDGLAIASMVLIALVSPSPAGHALALCYGVASSLALPLETIMLSLITNDLFGDASFNKLLGIVTAMNTAGYAVCSPLLNWCYDTCGSYVPAFTVFAVLMILVAVIFQWTISAAHKERQAVTAQQ